MKSWPEGLTRGGRSSLVTRASSTVALILQEGGETVAAGMNFALGTGGKDLSDLGKGGRCHSVPMAHLFPTALHQPCGPYEPPPSQPQALGPLFSKAAMAIKLEPHSRQWEPGGTPFLGCW